MKDLASTMYSEPYMLFQAGDRVKVVQKPTTPTEKGLNGRTGRFIEYTPKGYARVRLDKYYDALIHPENLQRIVICSVKGCGFYANDGSDFCPSHY